MEARVAGDNNIETKLVCGSPTSSSDANAEFLFLVAIDIDFNDWDVEYLHSWDEFEKKIESIVVLKVFFFFLSWFMLVYLCFVGDEG